MPEINKIKKHRFFSKKALSSLFLLGVFMLILAASGGFLTPKPALAASPNCDNSRASIGSGPRICELSGFSLKTDILVQDPKNPSSFVQGNFIRAGNESGKSQISFKVRITLQAPVDLIIGTDKIYFPSATSANLAVGGFGSTITPQDTKNTCGTSWSTTFTFGHDTYDKCQSDGNVTGTGIGSYDDIQQLSDGTNLKPGSIVYTSKVFTIPQRDFTKFRISNVGGLNQIIAFPNMQIKYSLSSNDWTTFVKGGFNIYVQLYPTDAAALAEAGQAPPSGVPPYGGTTANGSNVGGGGSPLLGLLNELIGFILGLIQELLYLIFYWLVAPLIQAMLSIRTYSDGFAAVIYPGWVVVRNVCNIIFIIALIAIGLGTLFRLESYQYKHLLVQLILAALLVNFSLVIAQAILGVADTVQSQFLPSNVEVIRSLAKNLILAYRNDVYGKTFADSGYFANTIKPLFMLMLAFGSFMVFLAIGAYLAIRIVMLWILMLISPVAYAAGVLPQTSHYRGEWWQTFLKYAFFTPIMAFFLNMSAVMIDASQKNPVLNKILQDPSVIGSDSSFASFVVSVGSNILLLVFLLVGLKVAESAGIYGASAITSVAKKGMFAPAAGAKWLTKDLAGGYIKKRYDNATAKLAEGGTFKKFLYAGLHVPTVVKAFRKDASEEQQRSKDLTAAAALSVKRKVPFFKRKGEDPLALYNEHKGKELLEERRGESSDSEQDEVKFALKLYEDAKSGDKDAQLMLPEQLRRMFKNHNMNEFVEQFAVLQGLTDKNGVHQNIGTLEDRKVRYNRDSLRGVMNEIQHNGAMTHLVNEEYQKRLGTLGYASDDFTGNELTRTDNKGKAHLIDVEFDSSTSSYQVVGQKDYNDLHEYLQATAVDDADYQSKLQAINKEVDEGRVGSAVAAVQASHPDFDINKYQNARYDRDKIRERNVNISKKLDMPQLQQWWESMVSRDANGNTVFGASGAHIFTHLNSGHEFLGTRGNPSGKILDLYLPLVKDKTQLRAELEKTIKQQAAAEGKKITNIDLAVDEQEYKNLRMAVLIEKDTDLNGIKAYDMVAKSTDPGYAAEQQTHINALRRILKK